MRLNEVQFSGYIKENITDKPVYKEPALAITFTEVPAKETEKFPPTIMDCMVQKMRPYWPSTTKIS